MQQSSPSVPRPASKALLCADFSIQATFFLCSDSSVYHVCLFSLLKKVHIIYCMIGSPCCHHRLSVSIKRLKVLEQISAESRMSCFFFTFD